MSTLSQGLSFIKLLKLSQSLLKREARSGQLSLIIISLVLAVTVATIISVFSARMEAGMLAKSTELLGADLRIRSSQAIPVGFAERAQRMGLSTSTILEFPSVVVAKDEMSLAAIKAVDDHYPLKGQLMVSHNAFKTGEQSQTGPPPGTVWLESRLLTLLDAKIGDQLELGKSTFTIGALLTQESDRGGNFYSLSPRLMMHLDDVEAAGLVQTGSRVTWRLLVAERGNDKNTAIQQNTPEPISEYKNWLKPILSSQQSLESLSDNNQAVSSALDKARQYLSLAAILAILLAGIAIAMAARNYAQHHFDTSALLRTLGASSRQVLWLFGLQLFTLALVTSIIGLVLGTLIQQQLSALLSILFVNDLPTAPWSAWAIASITAPVTLLGFALPHLIQLSRVSPLRILRRDLEPMSISAKLIYAIALVCILSLSIWFTRDIIMSLTLIVGGVVALGILSYGLRVLLSALDKLIPSKRFNLYIRFAWRHLMRNSQSASTQILAFAMILMVMLVISVVRNDLLEDWQQGLPEDAPNFFAMNIQSYESEAYQAALNEVGFTNYPLFPMIPGRLTHINEQYVHDNEKLSEDPALQRDLALTWSKDLPKGNKILEGLWLGDQNVKPEDKLVSIEARLANRLGIKLHDELLFEVAGQNFSVKVSSIRSVDWGTLSPNFYMILSKSALEGLPLSYLTSFHVPEGREGKLTQLIRDFPTITLLDMSMVFTQIQGLLQQVSLAVEYLLLLVLLGGVLVLLATLYASIEERIMQGAILRTLGASRKQLRFNQWSEFALLGLIAGILALLGTEAICFGLYNYLLDLDYQIQWYLWTWLPFSSALLIMILGALATRKVASQSPVNVLRET
jgi:putative ABC transport system permease protein